MTFNTFNSSAPSVSGFSESLTSSKHEHIQFLIVPVAEH